MKKFVRPAIFKGEIQLPASKSIAQRALMAALLVRGTSVLRGMTFCDDTYHALQMLRACGEEVVIEGTTVRVSSFGNFRQSCPSELFCGESALLTRLVTPLAALSSRPVTLRGEASLLRRPFGMVHSPLRQLGVTVSDTSGGLPLQLQGPLRGGEVTLDGQVTSQLVSGLLMALPLAEEDSVLQVCGLKSRPYVDMTLEILRNAGICIERKGYETFYVLGRQTYHPFSLMVERDWSAASCLLAAGCLSGYVCLPGLRIDSCQADRVMLDVLKTAGAICRIEPSGDGDFSVLAERAPLHAFAFDATDCPDLFPALVALASGCDGVSQIRGIHRLRHKESDRALVLREEFGKLEITITFEGDEMLVVGGPVRGGNVSSCGDHRVAMALAVAALRASSPVIIDGAEAVAKSYPEFWNAFDACCDYS